MEQLVGPLPLTAQHNVDEFSCGESALDTWLFKHALRAQNANTARVFVSTEKSKVVGFYALASAALLVKDLPSNQRIDLPRHPIPALLIARLAVDQGYQNRGVGLGMIQNAVQRAMQIREHAGLVCLIANAKNAKVRDFYVKAGFEPSPNLEGLVSLYLQTV